MMRATERTSSCGSRSCWRLARGKYRYSGAKADLDGVRQVILDPERYPPIRVKARGRLLSGRPGGMPLLPLTLPIRSQLQIENGACWESPCNAIFDNDGESFFGASN